MVQEEVEEAPLSHEDRILAEREVADPFLSLDTILNRGIKSHKKKHGWTRSSSYSFVQKDIAVVERRIVLREAVTRYIVDY